jgi:hypothetical protein
MNENLKRGTFRECLGHFRKVCPSWHAVLCEYTQRNRPTVYRWLQGGPIKGMDYLTVLSLLEAIGYTVTDPKFGPEFRKLGTLIGFRLVSTVEIANRMGWQAKDKNDITMRIFRSGAIGRSSDLENRITELNKELYSSRGADVVQYCKILRERVQKLPDQAEPVSEEDNAVCESHQGKNGAMSIVEAEQKVREHIAAMQDALEVLLSNKCSPQVRAAFRESFKNNALHGFRDLISGLLSEETRKKLQPRKD